MAEIITLKGESRIAECQGTGKVFTVDQFVLSYDPAIDPSSPIDRNAPLPSTDKIVYQEAVTQAGYVNPNQVVYSLFMDSTVGPFQFNRMDLVESATNTNVAIATTSTQNKIAEDPQHDIRGQNMTRNFMMVYDGAAAITSITVEAATWQIDFMARLHASDELERLSSRDTWGRSCFWRDGFLVKKVGSEFQLAAGQGYVAGIRIEITKEQAIAPGTLPTDVWLDVCRRGNLNGVTPEINVVFSGDVQEDYTDSQQVEHYLERIASIDNAGAVTDRRNVHPIDEDLLNYLVPEAPKDGKQYVRMDGRWVLGPIVGELRRFSFDTPPPGFFALDGSRIVNGKDDFSALANCGSRFIAISGNDLILADAVDFGRGKGSSGRSVGSFEDDAIRNIYGKHSGYAHIAGNSSGFVQAINTNPNELTITNENYDVNYFDFLFDASRVVPTAPENRPKSLTELVCIYHGVL